MKKFTGAIGLLMLAIGGAGLGWYYWVPILTAKEALRSKLRDPASAQFRDVRKIDPFTVCGEFRAGNEDGGHSAFARFYVWDKRGYLKVILPDAAPDEAKGGVVVGPLLLTTSAPSDLEVKVAPERARSLWKPEIELADLTDGAVNDVCGEKHR
jgi:hypothetical protein